MASATQAATAGAVIGPGGITLPWLQPRVKPWT